MDALMLPSNWQKIRLGDICEIVKGQQINKISLNNTDKYPVINGGIDFLGYTNKFNVSKNTIAISEGGTCGYVRFMTSDFWSGGHNYSLQKISNKVNNLCLYHILKSYEKDIMKLGVGSGLKNIQLKTLKDFEILLPPLNEQIAIANILSDLDHYLYSLDALILKKESVKKALRIKMLNQILASNGVEFRELGDIILSLKTGLNPRSFFKLNTPNANNYYVTIRELEDYTIKFTHQTDRIDDNALSLCLKRSNLEKDDILFSGTGTIGKVSIIEKNPNNWAVKEGIYSIKPNKKIVFPRFLMFCLESSNIQNDIKNKSFGGIVKSIPMNDLQQIQIPLPPLNEQIAIANVLSALDNEITSLKNKKRQFENIKKALNHDLMSAKIRVLNK
ncbi:restriction endonuclease subunit S [Helicobacter pylori]|uniref:restriction endonuclease subunit S n=1 Tax=Helicobacter pylori TaxID=210 RepID=UPI000BEB7092|nr:restriction endonuclease subunit S [Helicobacter pylori]PDW79335.1 restriction endonuclease subunit S [Helicobacter pylori]